MHVNYNLRFIMYVILTLSHYFVSARQLLRCGEDLLCLWLLAKRQALQNWSSVAGVVCEGVLQQPTCAEGPEAKLLSPDRRLVRLRGGGGAASIRVFVGGGVQLLPPPLGHGRRAWQTSRSSKVVRKKRTRKKTKDRDGVDSISTLIVHEAELQGIIINEFHPIIIIHSQMWFSSG